MTKSNKWFVVLAKDNKHDNYRHIIFDTPRYDVALEKVVEAKQDEYTKFTAVKLVALPSDIVAANINLLRHGLSDTVLVKFFDQYSDIY